MTIGFILIPEMYFLTQILCTMATQKQEIKMVGRVWKLLYYNTRGKYFVKMLQNTADKSHRFTNPKAKAKAHAEQLLATLKPILRDIYTKGFAKAFKAEMLKAFQGSNLNREVLGLKQYLDTSYLEGLQFNLYADITRHVYGMVNVDIEGTKVSYSHSGRVELLEDEVTYFNVTNYLLVFNESLDISVLLYLDDPHTFQVREYENEDFHNTPKQFDLADLLPIKKEDKLIVLTINKLTCAAPHAIDGNLGSLYELNTGHIIQTDLIGYESIFTSLEAKN